MSVGGSKSNSNSKNSSQGQDTMSGTTAFDETPTNPDWVSNLSQQIASTGTTLAGRDPTSYVANANPLLTQAAAGASSLSGTPWDYDAAESTTGQVANAKAPDIASNIDKFMSPYLANVVGATNAALDHSDSLQNQQDDLNLAASGAFGGSGAALTKAATRQAQGLSRGQVIGGLENQGYTTALGGATSQAQLQQQQQAQKLAAAAQMAQIADEYGANSRANIAAQTAAAAPLQAIDQAKATAPLDLNTWLAQILAGAQPGLYQGQTGNEAQNSTESQVSSGKGSTSGMSFGFKVPVGG